MSVSVSISAIDGIRLLRSSCTGRVIFRCQGVNLALRFISLSGTELQYVLYSVNELQAVDASYTASAAVKATVPHAGTLQLIITLSNFRAGAQIRGGTFVTVDL